MSTSPPAIRPWEFLAAFFIAAFGSAFRLVYHLKVVEGELSRTLFPDERNYYLAGAKLLEESGIGFFLTERSVWNGPLSIVWPWLFGGDVAAVKLANLLLLLLSTLFCWRLAREFSGALGGMLAVLLCSLHPLFAVFGVSVLTEAPFTFCVLASVLLFVRGGSSGAVRSSILAGLLMGAACLFRPAPQYLPFLLILFLPFVSKQLRRALLIFSASLLVVIVPWIVKNQLLFGVPSIASGSGAVLYLGNDLRTGGDEPVYSGRDFDTYQITKPHTHLDPEGDRRLKEEVVRCLSERPWDLLLLNLEKLPRFFLSHSQAYFFPSRDLLSVLRNEPLREKIVKPLSVLTTVWGSVFGVLGLITLCFSRSAALFPTLLVLYFWLLHTAAFPIPRMRLPIDPVLFAGAAYLTASVGQHRLRRIAASIFSLAALVFLLFGEAPERGQPELSLGYCETAGNSK